MQKINWYIIFSYYFPACNIWYMREPASIVQCNPFSGASIFALQCVVQAPVSAGPRLDIVWFFTNTGGNTVPINMNTTFPPLVSIASQNQTVMNGELIELTSTLTLGRFSDSIHAGRYYCQAQVVWDAERLRQPAFAYPAHPILKLELMNFILCFTCLSVVYALSFTSNVCHAQWFPPFDPFPHTVN